MYLSSRSSEASGPSRSSHPNSYVGRGAILVSQFHESPWMFLSLITFLSTCPVGATLRLHSEPFQPLVPSPRSASCSNLSLSSSAPGHRSIVLPPSVHVSSEAPKPGTRMTGVFQHASGLVSCRPHVRS